jgi:hypothetical protein
MAGSVGALDVPRVMSGARSTATINQLLDLATLARRDGVRGTPTFLAGRTGGTLTPLRVRSLDASAFGPALDRLLAS